MGVGISVGVTIGMALGPLFGNFGIGVAIGVAIGSGIGASLERRNKDNIRPMTGLEKKMQKWGVTVGLVIPLVLVGIFIALLLLRTR